MTIGAGLILIAIGAILRFGISTVSTHGFGIHTVGDILMLVGALGVVLWLLVFAPWAPRARSRRTVYREAPSAQVPPARYRDPGYREEVVDEVPTRRYPVEDPYDQYPR
jgi:hypothetical protein